MKKKGEKKNILRNLSEKRARRRLKRNRSFRRKRVKSGFVTQAKRYERDDALNMYSRQKETINKAPCSNFTLLENTDEVIEYIQTLKSYRDYYQLIKVLIIDLRGIKKIDIGAICILLSVVEELTLFKVPIEGNFPRDKTCLKVFIESGFLDHMKRITGVEFTKTQNKNLIIKQGRGKTRNKEMGMAIKNAVQKLTGVESHYHPVYSIIQEINGNAVEHAYDNKKHWLFGFNYDEENNKVIFTFADNGFGILRTIKKKISQKIFDRLNLRNDADILLRAFEKEYGSRHEEHENRNKGLPLLNKIQSEKEVKNLMVITNKVSLQLEKGSVKLLQSHYSGTFYYWELDVECIENGRKNN